MKLKYILPIIISVLVLITFNNYRQESHTKLTELESINLNQSKKTESKKNRVSNDKAFPSLKDELIEISQLINSSKQINLEENWEAEFGCINNQSCNYALLSANSLEEALWMKRKGYLSRSTIDLLATIPSRDLSKLANSGNLDAQKLMAIKTILNKDIKNAKGFSVAVRSSERNKETFGLMLTSQAYLLDGSPMLATVELKMAALLGDSNAALQYESLTINSGAAFIDNANQLAYSFLAAKYKTPVQDWNSDPRPGG